jgi:hypothetical protein
VRPVALLDVLGGADFRWTYDNGDQIESTICVFACEIVGGAVHCDGTETVEARWVEPVEVPGMLPLPFPAALFSGG